MPVREIHEFVGPEEPRSYPERFQNLSLIDSISYLLLATELDRDVVQSYLATLATPNQLIQLTVCCSRASASGADRAPVEVKAQDTATSDRKL